MVTTDDTDEHTKLAAFDYSKHCDRPELMSNWLELISNNLFINNPFYIRSNWQWIINKYFFRYNALVLEVSKKKEIISVQNLRQSST